ncbi:hypothetical protein ACOME3_010356 [Neoechinorhynchus agilis]
MRPTNKTPTIILSKKSSHLTRCEPIDLVDAIVLSNDTKESNENRFSKKINILSATERTLPTFKTIRDFEIQFLQKRSSISGLDVAIISIAHIALLSGAIAIVVSCNTGNIAKRLSRYRLECPIICVTNSESLARELVIYRGVVPLLILNWHIKAVDDFGEGDTILEALAAVKSSNPFAGKLVNVVVLKRKWINSMLLYGTQVICI